jgi:hypothetical protein
VSTETIVLPKPEPERRSLVTNVLIYRSTADRIEAMPKVEDEPAYVAPEWDPA